MYYHNRRVRITSPYQKKPTDTYIKCVTTKNVKKMALLEMNEKPFLHLNELYIRDEKEMTRWVKTWSKSSRKAYDGESVLVGSS